MKISSEEFVRLWQSSSSMTEFCDKAGITKQSAYVRWQRMTKYGVPLKKLTADNRWPALIKLAKELAPESNGAA